MICKDIELDKVFIKKKTLKHKLVITGQNKSSVEISCGGLIIHRHDIATSHEKADNIIVQQAIRVAVDEWKPVTVLADHTDVYILLLYHYLEQGFNTQTVMESPIKERTVTDIQATVQKHKEIIPSMLPAHSLTGCDTVAACFGIDKGTMLKVLKNGIPLHLLGNVDAPLLDVLEESTKFMAACYGQSKSMAKSMSEVMLNVWITRTGKRSLTSAPKIYVPCHQQQRHLQKILNVHICRHAFGKMPCNSILNY